MVSQANNNAGIARQDYDDSDYGSDFSADEERLVDQLLADIASENNSVRDFANNKASATTTTQTRIGQFHVPRATPALASLSTTRLPAAITDRPERSVSPCGQAATRAPLQEQRITSLGPVQYPDLSHALSRLESEPASAQRGSPRSPAKKTDTRSPLQRFRSFPKRPLTVTDLATGAWCELQHWYTISMLPGGRKTRTPAMRAGSRVHEKLEDEVHTAVQVPIATKEEAFALRLWNIIQGLRTLSDTGLTRELEVWGKVDGEIINGVIDQLSHESPDASFEEELTSSNGFSSPDDLGPNHRMVYLTDVKTRGSDRLPTGTALRPARVQLFLYHKLLSDMADDKLNYSDIFQRYGVRPEVPFSDAFMAQIGGLHDEVFYDADSEIEDTSTMSQSPDLVRYRTISQIIPLLKTELKVTFPHGSASIGILLSVQYRHRDDGHIIGLNNFPNDPGALDAYAKNSLKWWRGEREPNGVSIEEAYKCGWCEFADGCQWRKDKETEFVSKRRVETRDSRRVSPTS